MHVCHFCDTSFEGEFFRLMTGQANKAVVVACRTRSPVRPDLAHKGHCVVAALTGKLSYPFAVRQLWQTLKQKVDILHTHLSFAGLIGVLDQMAR